MDCDGPAKTATLTRLLLSQVWLPPPPPLPAAGNWALAQDGSPAKPTAGLGVNVCVLVSTDPPSGIGQMRTRQEGAGEGTKGLKTERPGVLRDRRGIPATFP